MSARIDPVMAVRIEAYRDWLANGGRDLVGTIDITAKPVRGEDRDLGHCFIQPDAFPEQRIYCGLGTLSLSERKGRLTGRRVRFDLAPQEYSEARKAVAHNLRLVFAAQSLRARARE